MSSICELPKHCSCPDRTGALGQVTGLPCRSGRRYILGSWTNLRELPGYRGAPVPGALAVRYEALHIAAINEWLRPDF